MSDASGAPERPVKPWTPDDVAVRSPAVYSVVIDDEAVLLDEASERLHHLNASATLVWECLDGHATVATLAREISDELDEPYDTVLGDALAIVTDLDAEELLAPRHAGPTDTRTDTDTEPRWRRRPDVLWRRSLDAVLVLPVGADEPVTLGGTGPALWELLAEPCTVAQIAAVLSEAYDAEPATVVADVAPVVDELVRLQALESA